MRNIPFSPPFIDENVKREVMDVLDSGWITTGPKTLQLEQEIAKYIGVETTVSCNSWSSGAQIVLKYLGIGEGDEVIVPNYTYAATALAVYHVGAKPVAVDVDDNYQMDLEQVRSVINSKTKAIIPVDIGGLPTDFITLKDLLEQEKYCFQASSEILEIIGRVAIISDAAHSFGAKIGASKTGSYSDFTVFSLHAVKNLTSAEGGIISFNLPREAGDVAGALKLLRLNGQTKDALAKTKNPANWEYDIILKGYKMNMPDICAAIALGQMKSYDSILEERKRVTEQYHKYFSNQSHFTILRSEVDNRFSSNHLLMIQLNDKTKKYRNDIITLCSEKGISLNVHFKPLSLMTAFKDEFSVYECPKSIALFSSEISLPIYPQLTNDDIEYISETILSVIEDLVND